MNKDVGAFDSSVYLLKWAHIWSTTGSPLITLYEWMRGMFLRICFEYSQWYRTIKCPPENPSLPLCVVPVQSQVAVQHGTPL